MHACTSKAPPSGRNKTRIFFIKIGCVPMKLIALSLPVTCFAIVVRGPSRLLAPRRLRTSVYPAGCTPEQKPDDEIFCVTGILDATEGLRLDLLVNLFDADNTSKSTYVNYQASFDGSTPTGLNLTGGGCANVLKEGFDDVLEGTVGLCFEALPESIGKLDPDTGYWNASIRASVMGTATIFGEDVSVGISDTVDAHFGPNYDLGFVVSLEQSTDDDKRVGLAVALDFSLNSQENTPFNWDMAATARLRGWFRPLFDKEARRELFKRELQIPLR